MAASVTLTKEKWPSLALEEWQDTYETLRCWMQVVGKVRLSQSPWLNHSWAATLYPTATGLTTCLIPNGDVEFQIDFDFVSHLLRIVTTEGRAAQVALEPQSVAAFYRSLLAELAKLGLAVSIHGSPNEVEDPIPFARDEVHQAYDPEAATRFWRVLIQAARVMTEFRARFIGKCSPVHFFWGSPDLAVTRFSGRPAPRHPGGIPNLPDWVTREAYSHEVSSCGFWPGGSQLRYPTFYSYAYPEPEGFSGARVGPAGAFYSTDLREFLLPYDVVRNAPSPDDTLLEFLQSTYEAAADLAHWDRSSLERDDPRPRRWVRGGKAPPPGSTSGGAPCEAGQPSEPVRMPTDSVRPGAGKPKIS
jgi:hypothetical protein